MDTILTRGFAPYFLVPMLPRGNAWPGRSRVPMTAPRFSRDPQRRLHSFTPLDFSTFLPYLPIRKIIALSQFGQFFIQPYERPIPLFPAPRLQTIQGPPRRLSYGGETASTGVMKQRLHTERLSARKSDGNLNIIADDYNFAVAA